MRRLSPPSSLVAAPPAPLFFYGRNRRDAPSEPDRARHALPGLDGGEVVRNLDVAAISSRRQTRGGAIVLDLTNQSLRRNKIDTVPDRGSLFKKIFFLINK